MYVRGYLQGSENGRVVTIAIKYAFMHCWRHISFLFRQAIEEDASVFYSTKILEILFKIPTHPRIKKFVVHWR